MIPEKEIFDSRIMVVDDNRSNVDLLEGVLTAEGYQSILCLTDSRQAQNMYMVYKPDLVLLDINMPYYDGYEVLHQFRRIEDSYTPVLVLTAQHDSRSRIKALKSGAQDFLTKPFDKIETLTRIRNQITVRLMHNRIKDQNVILEKKVQERTIELQETRLEIIHRLGRAAEYRDNETGGHIVRLSKMVYTLALLAGMDDMQTKLLLDTSPMHDIGKIGVPDNILLKPEKLSAGEWKIMKTHTTIGAKLLEGHDSMLMKSARTIALTHHEKWNGTGYPQRLAKNQIPFEGRLVGIVDVFDALTSHRPYKNAYPTDVAASIIQKEREQHFDPEITDLFLDNLEEFVRIKNQYSIQESPQGAYILSDRDLPAF